MAPTAVDARGGRPRTAPGTAFGQATVAWTRSIAASALPTMKRRTLATPAAFALAVVVGLLVVGAFLLLDCRLENVAERSAAVGGAVLRHRLFLLGDLQRL